MTYEEFVSEVSARTGLTEAEAARTTELCLRVLGGGISELPARRLNARLPERIAVFLKREGPVRSLTSDMFFREVAEAEGVALGTGLEHSEVVLQTLWGALDDECRRLLREDLPPELLEAGSARPGYHPPPERPVHMPDTARRTHSETSLSEGRPASYAPVSEAGKKTGS